MRVRAQTTSLSSAQPTYEERSCIACAGTGKGRSASGDDLRRYFSEPSHAPEDLFALAKAVAATSKRPKAMESRIETFQVSYGFLGRKTRTESVTRETELDYWVLVTKKSFEREFADEEVDDNEIRFCLAADGSLLKLRRTQHSYHDERFGWSGWEFEPLTDLDHYMVDFDFAGDARFESSYFLRFTDVVDSILTSYLDSTDSHFSLRRLYPKGVGLYVALKGLAS